MIVLANALCCGINVYAYMAWGHSPINLAAAVFSGLITLVVGMDY